MNELEKNPPSTSGQSQSPPRAQAKLDFNDDEALAQLQRADLSALEIALLAKSFVTAKNRKIAMGIVLHPRTPRHVSVPLLRRMFTFDLMRVSLTPQVAADIRRSAEDQILVRTESLSAGEKISLAKRASGRVAAALLQENDARVILPALENTRLTEALVVQALTKARAPAVLFARVSANRKWSQRREVQIALLRSTNTPLEWAQEFTKNFSEEFLREIVPQARFEALFR